jgi:hypothetical protein
VPRLHWGPYIRVFETTSIMYGIMWRIEHSIRVRPWPLVGGIVERKLTAAGSNHQVPAKDTLRKAA